MRPLTLTVADIAAAGCGQLAGSAKDRPEYLSVFAVVHFAQPAHCRHLPAARCQLMRILNAAQMREADRFTIEEIGIPSLVLMENAGRQVVAAMEAGSEERLNGRGAVLCGRGNNGGDGFVVARTLLQRGVDVSVFVLGELASVRG